MRPVADRHDLTMLQLACQWNLAHEPVGCVVPTLIQEEGTAAKPIERKRAELAELPAGRLLSEEEVDTHRKVGDNRGCMLLKGATPDHEGEERPDRWMVKPEQEALARRHGIDPERDLRKVAEPVPS
jgi:Ser/Thr protein kinase RdoA (MazF antagonist)